MIAVCGIGRPNGRLNSATTAYQSARPPIVAASAKAATKPKIGCTCSRIFATANSVKVPASTNVACALTRFSSAARCASPGASKEKVAGRVMTAREKSHVGLRIPRHCERSEAIQGRKESLDCFVACAPRNDGEQHAYDV